MSPEHNSNLKLLKKLDSLDANDNLKAQPFDSNQFEQPSFEAEYLG